MRNNVVGVVNVTLGGFHYTGSNFTNAKILRQIVDYQTCKVTYDRLKSQSNIGI